MFDIGASELLLIVIVAILAVGPSEIPNALRTAGRWIAKVRKVSGHFRSGIESMIREAELEDMEKQWRDQNAAIMAQQSPVTAAAEAALTGPNPGTPDAVLADVPAPASEPAPGAVEPGAVEPGRAA